MPLRNYTLNRNDLLRVLFGAYGGLRGYVNENTGFRHILYFFVGCFGFDPAIYYSIAHGIGSTSSRFMKKMKEENAPTIVIYKKRMPRTFYN